MAPTTNPQKKPAAKPSASTAGPSSMPKHSQPKEKTKTLDGKTVLRNAEEEEFEKANAMVEKDGVEDKKEKALINALVERENEKAAAPVPMETDEPPNGVSQSTQDGNQASQHSPETFLGTPITRGIGFGDHQPDMPLPSTEIKRQPQETVGQESEMQEDEEDEEDKEVLWSPTVNRKRQGLKEWDVRHIGTLRRESVLLITQSSTMRVMLSEKRWETRTTVRAYWGTGKADKGIYMAAIAQEDRFENWSSGKREGRDASATPGRQLTPARSERSATVEIDRASREPTPVTAKTKAVRFNKNEDDDKMAKTRAIYEKMYGKSFAQMSREERREMMSVLADE